MKVLANQCVHRGGDLVILVYVSKHHPELVISLGRVIDITPYGDGVHSSLNIKSWAGDVRVHEGRVSAPDRAYEGILVGDETLILPADATGLATVETLKDLMRRLSVARASHNTLIFALEAIGRGMGMPKET